MTTLTDVRGQDVAVLGLDDRVLTAAAVYRLPAVAVLTHVLTDLTAVVSALVAAAAKEMVLHRHSLAHVDRRLTSSSTKRQSAGADCQTLTCTKQSASKPLIAR